MRLIAILSLLAIAACQNRVAEPVHLAQPTDDRLTCTEIAEKRVENRKQAARLVKLDEGVALSNAFAITLSQVWFWPAIMGVDMSDVEEIEARALQDRNQRLIAIAKEKSCPPLMDASIAARL